MKKISFTSILLFLSLPLLMLACNQETTEVESPKETVMDPVSRGEYLVTIMGCDDCHTSKVFGPNGPELDMNNRLGGHLSTMPIGTFKENDLKQWVLMSHTTTAFAGPWGVSYAANLTSHPSGIGSWTEAQFIKSMREGKSKGLENSRPILPPMPWFNLKQATDEDLKAIFAYLKSTPPVNNSVPAPVPPTHMASAPVAVQ